MSTPRFVVNLQNSTAGTEGLAYGTIAENPEVRGVADVTPAVNGSKPCIAVWTRGRYADYWEQQPATAEQIAAFDAAKAKTRPPRVAVAASSTGTLPIAGQPCAWAEILAKAEQSGEMTPELRAQALRMAASKSIALKPAVTQGAARSADELVKNLTSAQRM